MPPLFSTLARLPGGYFAFPGFACVYGANFGSLYFAAYCFW
jgi:hypothetical protein